MNQVLYNLRAKGWFLPQEIAITWAEAAFLGTLTPLPTGDEHP